MNGLAFRRSILLAGTLASSLGWATAVGGVPAQAETMHANYRVSLIGLPIGLAVADGSVGDSRYKVDLHVKLTGLAAIVSSLRMALSSSGAYQGGQILPAGYATIASNSKETRTLRMALSDHAVRQIEISPFWDDSANPERIPLTEAHKRDVIDPLSAFIMPVPDGSSAVGPSACNRRVPVFDGYTRFDVTLTYAGVKEIKTNGYSGPVTICTARYVPIAGHKPSNKATQFMADNKDMTVWLAPVPHLNLVVPYRVSLMTMAGTAVIEASELRFSP